MNKMPMPKDEREKGRIEHAGLVCRMLDGLWKEDARDYVRSFYHESVRTLLMDASTARNPLLSLCVQLGGIFDRPGVVRVKGMADDIDLAPLTRKRLWALLEGVQTHLVGVHEVVARLTFSPKAGLRFDFLDAWQFQDCEPHPAAPDQFGVARLMVERQRSSTEIEWTRETWDVLASPPVFKIEAMRKDSTGGETWTDVTLEYVPGYTGAYPYMVAGEPVMPLVILHDRIGSTLWSKPRGQEVVQGTLDTAALHTWWLTGTRDGSSPLRCSVDLHVVGSETSGDKGIVPITPGSLIQFFTKGEKGGQFHQFSPTMDPKSFNEAIDDFIRGTVIYAGVAASDLQTGEAQSGYAIALSKEGQRRMQAKLEPAAAVGVALILATAAKLVGGAWPTDPEAYDVTFVGVPKSADEVRVETETAMARRAAGVLSAIDHLRQYPEFAHFSDEEALVYLIRAAEAEAMLSKIKTPIALTPEESPEQPPDEADDDVEDQNDTETNQEREEASDAR